jgi:hypothetical protein
VGPEDIVELDLDAQPVHDEGRSLYLERFIRQQPDLIAIQSQAAELRSKPSVDFCGYWQRHLSA